jgi:hypothetical protein
VSRVPADALLHPAVPSALALFVLNDHVLKGAGVVPGAVTGKLSDFTGLVFFPLLLVALAELARGALGRPWGPHRRDVVLAVGLTAVVFTLVQIHPPSGDMYRGVSGGLRWLTFDALRGVPMRPVKHVMDPTDLVALVALVVPWSIGMRRAGLPGVVGVVAGG